MTPAQVHDHMQKYVTELLNQEQFLRDAVRLKEVLTVEQLSTDLIEKIPQWLDTESADPYTACDTAWHDLSLWAGAQAQLLRRGESAVLLKIERQEKSDYEGSKSKCLARVKSIKRSAGTYGRCKPFAASTRCTAICKFCEKSRNV